MKLRFWAGLSACLMLVSACSELANPMALFGETAPTSIAVTDSALNVVGPDGFCIDSRSSKAATGFALLAPCQILGRTPTTLHAIGTVQVGVADTAIVSDDASQFSTFLSSDQGRTLLSSDGEISDLRVTTTNEFVVVTFEDQGTPPLSGLGSQEARAFFDLSGRMVSVSFRGITQQPVALDTLAQLVEVTVESMRSANAASLEISG